MQRREFLRNLGLAVPGLAVAGWQPLIETVWAAEAPIDLVKDGAARCAIVIGKNATPPERHAAEELRTYFKKVVGADVPIVAEGAATSTQFPLYLGTLTSCPTIEKFGLRTKVNGLSDEGFLRRVDKRGLAITAKTPIGVLYGTYSFIEDSLGVRWLMPGEDGESFKKKPSVTVQPMEAVQNPAFMARSLAITCTNINAPLNDTWDWMARNKMQVNTGYKPFWTDKPGTEKMEEIGARFRRGGHALASFVPNEMFEAHPEYFALVDGVRHRSDAGGSPEGRVYQRCTSNPAVIELAVQYIKNFFREKPQGDAFLIGNNDGNGWCECDNCRALDDPWEREHGIVSTRFYKFINAVAGRVWEEFPNKTIESWGYQQYRTAPRGVIPDPRLHIGVCLYGRCFRHALDDPNCPTNVQVNRIFKEWFKFKSTIGQRAYYADAIEGGAGEDFPYIPLEDIVAHDIKSSSASGSTEWVDETPPPDGVFGPTWNRRAVRESWRARFPMYYVAAKLLWNPKLDVEELKTEAFQGYFGDAGSMMKSYRELLSKAWQETKGHFIYGAAPIGIGRSLAQPGLEQQLLGYLDEAAKKVEEKPEMAKRVALEKEYLTEVWIKNARALEQSTSWNDVNAKQREGTIKIDGQLHESDWLAANTTTGFTKMGGKELAQVQTFAKVLYDSNFIYLGLEMMEPSPKTLKMVHTERDGNIWEDDDIEIFLDPQRTGDKFFHFIVNPKGAVYDSTVSGGVEDKSFNADYDVTTKVLDDRWIMEMKISLASLQAKATNGDTWKVNIARSRRAGDIAENSSWTDGGFNQPGSFRPVVFGEEPAPLQNGGFETVKELKDDKVKAQFLRGWKSGNNPVLAPTGWSLHESHPGKITIVAEDAHSGKNACKVEKGWIFNMFPAATGEKLHIEFWAKGQGSVQSMLFQYEESPEGKLKNVPTQTLETIQLTEQWAKYSFDQTITTADVRRVALCFAADSELILDDVSVQKAKL